MSIIIQFNSSTFAKSTIAVPSTSKCQQLNRHVKLEMVPGIEHSDVPGMTDDENSIDIASSSIFSSTSLKEVKFSSNHFGSCFGLPYQDHNYGAPPPPTPPVTSPCPSPTHSAPILDEDTTLSVISNSTNEDAPEESITRCICGFEHDDEYMICCDNCLVWQHVDCMGLDRSNIPDTYLCDKCEPRKLDRHKAKLLQSRKKNSLTAKSPNSNSVKPETSFNNRLFGKDSKKKSFAQISEDWTNSRKTEFRDGNSLPVSQRFCYSTDSDEEVNKNFERRPKTRSKRRKKEEEKSSDNLDLTTRKKSKKHGKERMEAKRSKLRRGKNKESTSTADEEAQDAWEYSLEWCEKNFEDAINNQYTPEIQHLARTLSLQGFEKKYLEQMRTKQCHAYDDGKRKQLVCLRDLPRNSPLIEYKGKFLLASQFLDIHPLYNRRLYPYVLFYLLDQKEICVDASMYGNDARFVRRSCKPNAEIRHMVYNGKLHLYLASTKVIFREDEVTIPLINHPNDNLKDFECACGTDECLVKPKKKNGTIEVCQEKRRRTRRSTITADEDSNHSVDARVTRNQAKASSILNEKPKVTAVKSEPVETQAVPVETVTTPIKEEPEIKSVSDYETDENTAGEKRKLTREERKLDAILRAFRQMEQAEKRKQLALEKQKSHHPKTEASEEKQEEIKKEDKTGESPPETHAKEEDKPTPQTPKSKKGKRRRGSGTPSRRRTRTNSGGSDLLSLDETSPTKTVPSPETNSISCNENVVQVPCSSPTPTSNLSLLSPVSSSAPASSHILKTKRALMNEWLQEKSEAVINAPLPSPLPVHTEMNCNIQTQYVRCTKDTPHSSGISAAHLRRSNSATHLKPATGQGSAKKRWLRQAMYDCHGCEIQVKFDSSNVETSSNFDNGCLSPSSHGDVDSLNGVAEDVLTPLKKRRLMRESIESLPSPQSPSTATSIDDTDATTVSNSLISDNSTEQGSDAVEAEASKELSLSPSCLKDSSPNLCEIKPDSEESCLTTNEASKKCFETSFGSISSVELISGGNSSHETMEPVIHTSEKSPSQKDNENIEEPSAVNHFETHLDCFKTNANSSPLETCTNVKSPSNVTDLPEKKVLSNADIDACDVTSENQSSSEVAETEKKDTEIIAQEQSPSVSAAIITPSLVNNITDVEISNASCSYPSVENSSAPVATEHLPFNEEPDKDSKSDISNLSTQDNKPIFPNKTVKNQENISSSGVKCETLESPETTMLVNKHTGDSTNCSSDALLNQTLYSSLSSCNNVDISNFSDNVHANDAEVVMKVEKIDIEEMKKEKPKENVDSMEDVMKDDSQSRCTSNEDCNLDNKGCASATKKRKVSLSEYRMRMKENSSRVRSNSETSCKTSSSTSICAIALPSTLPEQVTLAPLPLFDKIRTRVSTSTQELSQTMTKKNETLKKEDNQEISEHRENLTERLKREFGFDVSESGTGANVLKSKITGVSTSDATEIGAPQSPPPPPPPPRPRHIRPTMQTVVNSSLPPSQFGFSAPPFPRPQFMVTQVSGAPYLQTQPPIIPHVHQLNTNPARCSLQPPLLPSSHPFSSTMPGTLLRPPPSHDYTPVNAQRFAAMVQQPPPPPPHKSYLHVYPSVLYK